VVSQRSGYQLQKGFEGSLLSRTGKFQPESFELYKRGVQARNYSLSSIIEMHDEEVADQLLWGIYELSEAQSRWVSPASA
jgi:hypothetical protein